MKKRLGFFVMFSILLAAVCCFVASAEQEGYIIYTEETDAITITGLKITDETEIVIPETIHDKPVTTIKSNLSISIPRYTSIFSNKERPETPYPVYIPKTVTNIGAGAFYHDPAAIGRQVCELPVLAFYVDEDNPVYTSDAYGAIYNKSMDTLVMYPNRCTQDEYTIPDTVTTVAADAFKSASVDLLRLPASLTDFNPVQSTGFIDSYEVDPGNPVYANDASGNLCSKDKTILLKLQSKDTDYTLPSSIKAIGPYAFQRKKLDKLTIPATVQTIQSNAFSACTIKAVDFESSVQASLVIEEKAFCNCVSPSKIMLPIQISSISQYAFQGSSIQEIVFSSDATESTHLDSYAFAQAGALRIVRFSPVQQEISDYCFFGDNNLTLVQTPENGLKSIGSYAFQGCNNLQAVTYWDEADSILVPMKVETIEDHAFYRAGIKSLWFQSGLISVGAQAFYGMNRLERVVFPNTMQTLDPSAFNNAAREIVLYFEGRKTIFESMAEKLYHNPNDPEDTNPSAFKTKYFYYSYEFDSSVYTHIKVNMEGDTLAITGTGTIPARTGGSPPLIISLISRPTLNDGAYIWDVWRSSFYPLNDTSVRVIRIGGEIQYIGSKVFASLDALKTVIVQSDSLSFANDAFYNCAYTETVIVDGKATNPTSCFENSEGTTPLTRYSYNRSDNTTGNFLTRKFTYTSGELSFERGAIYDFDRFLTTIKAFHELYPDLNAVSMPSLGISDHSVYQLQDGKLIQSELTSLPGGIITAQDSNGKTIPLFSCGNYNNTTFRLVAVQDQTEYVIPIKYGIKIVSGAFAYTKSTDTSDGTTAQIKSIDWKAATETAEGTYSNALTIPSAIDEVPVSTLSAGACKDMVFDDYTLNSVTIPESVKTIESGFFNGLQVKQIIVNEANETYYADESGVLFSKDGTKLIKVPSLYEAESYTVPEGVTTIAAQAFSECANLQEIMIPEGVVKIESYAFRDCSALKKLSIPTSVSSSNISNDACVGCTATPEIAFAGTEKNYGSKADALYLDINDAQDTNSSSETPHFQFRFAPEPGTDDPTPDEPTLISGTCGERATWTFDETTSTLTISGEGALEMEGRIKIDENGGESQSFDPKDSPFYAIRRSVKTIIVEDGITNLGDMASTIFDDFRNTTEVTLGQTIMHIDCGAFDSMLSLERIVVDAENPYLCSTADGCLYSADLTQLIKYPPANEQTTFAIPEHVLHIACNAFTGCQFLESVVVPQGITSLYGGFEYARSIKRITLPDTLKSINDQPFIGCGNLTDLVIPDSVTDICLSGFQSCLSLDLVIPAEANLTNVDEAVGLHSITIDGNSSLYQTQDGVLFSKDMKTLLMYPGGSERTIYTVPDSVEHIGDKAFECTIFLETVDLPQSLVTIGKEAFYGSLITSITLPENVETIDTDAFLGAFCMDRIVIKGKDTQLEERAIGFTEAIIPDITREDWQQVLIADATIDYVAFDPYIDRIIVPDYENGEHYLPLDVTIVCHNGSTAMTYAQENGVTVEETHFFEDWFYDWPAMERVLKCIYCDALDEPAREPIPEELAMAVDLTNGILTLSGIDTLPASADDGSSVWDTDKADVQVLIIGADVKHVPANTFCDYPNLSYVIVEGSETVFADGAFRDCPAVSQVLLRQGGALSGNAFRGESGTIQVYYPQASTSAPTAGSGLQPVPFAFNNGTLTLQQPVTLDLYTMIDLLTVFCDEYADIEILHCSQVTIEGITLYGTDEANGIFKRIDDNTLYDATIYPQYNGETVSFNALLTQISDTSEGAQTFRLVAKDSIHEEIKDTPVEVDPPKDDNDPKPGKPESGFIIGIKKILKAITRLFDALFRIFRRK